jgi:hypothetical protein
VGRPGVSILIILPFLERRCPQRRRVFSSMWHQINNIATLCLQVLPACHTTSSLSASLTCSWHLLVFGATNQQTWLRHKRSPESSLEAYEQITQNGQDILLHTEGPNDLNIPADANWILVANKAHHPKQTEQIPVRQGSKWTESTTSLERLITVSLFSILPPVELHQRQILSRIWSTNAICCNLLVTFYLARKNCNRQIRAIKTI